MSNMELMLTLIHKAGGSINARDLYAEMQAHGIGILECRQALVQLADEHEVTVAPDFTVEVVP